MKLEKAMLLHLIAHGIRCFVLAACVFYLPWYMNIAICFAIAGEMYLDRIEHKARRKLNDEIREEISNTKYWLLAVQDEIKEMREHKENQ